MLQGRDGAVMFSANVDATSAEEIEDVDAEPSSLLELHPSGAIMGAQNNAFAPLPDIDAFLHNTGLNIDQIQQGHVTPGDSPSPDHVSVKFEEPRYYCTEHAQEGVTGQSQAMFVDQVDEQDQPMWEEQLQTVDMHEVRKNLGKMQPLIIKEVVKDIEVACKLLNIPSDPHYWTVEHVEKWLLWTLHQYRLPPLNLDYFRMSGVTLCMLSEDDFRFRAPRCGDILYAHLDVWKTASRIAGLHIFPESEEEDLDKDDLSSTTTVKEERTSPPPSCNGVKGLTDRPPIGPITSMTPNHQAGIHLWQFLKELLLQPESYSHCIRWIDRDAGIFKIEDSVEVARLWGLRKNRPAMNYDKLSRSIRQYYRKGIIKKTDISQRLVYQFCQPIAGVTVKKEP
ncbi:SAM pointed domain-containing Ets transcription factor-like isoform X1 [Branchiostoma lanceolatum]|uniref:SAM pointed domain-containing Ets transcription factor-like isoform X1 n=1 Tax=Branchiostoma lanceolatum TaxID=7740 RepID=UPI003456D1E4